MSLAQADWRLIDLWSFDIRTDSRSPSNRKWIFWIEIDKASSFDCIHMCIEIPNSWEGTHRARLIDSHLGKGREDGTRNPRYKLRRNELWTMLKSRKIDLKLCIMCIAIIPIRLISRHWQVSEVEVRCSRMHVYVPMSLSSYVNSMKWTQCTLFIYATLKSYDLSEWSYNF